ncbi:vegetative cell wall protein gp1-like, partial [Gopherus evgoodei]|uniref:vegetative cell wall protein gp1-like n=1 Tax=Gopherus evgoodei TaxID=1825980 RepID=UPI0011D000F7
PRLLPTPPTALCHLPDPCQHPRLLPTPPTALCHLPDHHPHPRLLRTPPLPCATCQPVTHTPSSSLHPPTALCHLPDHHPHPQLLRTPPHCPVPPASPSPAPLAPPYPPPLPCATCQPVTRTPAPPYPPPLPCATCQTITHTLAPPYPPTALFHLPAPNLPTLHYPVPPTRPLGNPVQPSSARSYKPQGTTGPSAPHPALHYPLLPLPAPMLSPLHPRGLAVAHSSWPEKGSRSAPWARLRLCGGCGGGVAPWPGPGVPVTLGTGCPCLREQTPGTDRGGGEAGGCRGGRRPGKRRGGNRKVFHFPQEKQEKARLSSPRRAAGPTPRAPAVGVMYPQRHVLHATWTSTQLSPASTRLPSQHHGLRATCTSTRLPLTPSAIGSVPPTPAPDSPPPAPSAPCHWH